MFVTDITHGFRQSQGAVLGIGCVSRQDDGIPG
jgi:hypothetical protein